MSVNKRTWGAIDLKLWGFSILFAVVIPLLAGKLHLVHRTWLVGLFLLIINTIVCVWVGHYLRSNQLRWWNIFVLPGLFLIMAFFFLPKYTWYFAIFYLGVIYLSWSMMQTNN
ncbi:hypothetical protein FD27_GL000765 [Limosilactobacillus frumenti DSM 13145]|uniref:Uncharacterized protein n=1 Tax=Limosilactobacillus frumenti DSM 13145 TaxID=1423746 RepID=A0A0R1PBV8_9LACO|nr:hypothetical protein [Limosilactobacillus frumenti]KRL27018.1 hypothetical protein FD27_GL000765 [Limosilactobacillus frumenti DSM 13145]MBA2914195.1 hypothetical protein [Limosilactobacillus frumenti]QFG72493.1 hypothetical protein LF145_03685 [Limosilactobacillus frumenti]